MKTVYGYKICKDSVLREADLSRANLEEVNLTRSDLYAARLQETNLRRAKLVDVNLCLANLYKANLFEADLFGASLGSSILCYANLYGACLDEADLSKANLWGAQLGRTCLDPNNKPNAHIKGFERKDQYVIGYRTRSAWHIDGYRDNRTYSADWFSTSSTECHPGLYIWPTIQQARWSYKNAEIIKVLVKPEDVHKAGSKWRCRQFTVIGSII